MKKIRIFWAAAITFLLQLIPAIALASEGLDVPEDMKRVVPLDGLPGYQSLVAHIYNDHRLAYAFMCVVLMLAVGGIIALGTDVILKALGMDVEKIEHKE